MNEGTSARYIGSTIRDLRNKMSMTGDELGQKVGLSQSKISKLENGYKGNINVETVVNILNILKAPKTIIQQVSDCIDDIHMQKSMTAQYDHNYHFGEYIGFERSSKTVRICSFNIVPAILQTVEYRQESLKTVGLNDEALSIALRESIARQDSLWEHGREYIILMHEASLYTCVVSNGARMAQLDRLARMIGYSKITIGIIPVKAGMLAAETGNFVLYDDRLLVYTLIYSDERVDDPALIAQYARLFTELSQLACYGEDARRLVYEAMDELN